jgi:ABC-2 type transport system permease protein
MIPTIKAELRKVFTIRSTYIILMIVLLLLLFFGFFISGWRIDSSDLHNPTTLVGDAYGAVSIVSVFIGVITVLLMTHEYRYNTILQTLTLANKRSKVLLAKILVVSVLAIIFTFIIVTLSPLLALWGLHAHHLNLVHQQIPYLNLLWRSLFYGWGYAMLALLIAVLIRNQIGSIATLLIVPGTVEALIGLLLKSNVVYLPFSALKTVVGEGQYPNSITAVHAAMVFTAYLIVGGAIGWILFLRRDAN